MTTETTSKALRGCTKQAYHDQLMLTSRKLGKARAGLEAIMRGLTNGQIELGETLQQIAARALSESYEEAAQ